MNVTSSQNVVRQAQASQSIRDSLSRSNRRDDFFFAIPSAGRFRAALSGIRRNANIDLLLFNSNNQRIASSRRPGRRREVINFSQLDTGIYKLRAILRGKNRSAYRLVATTDLFRSANGSPPPELPPITTPDPTDLTGNTLATARSISSPTSLTESVGASDTDDFYTFTVGESGSPTGRVNLAITRTTLEGSADVDLRDELGNIVASTFISGSDGGWSFNSPLKAGTYSLQIQSFTNTFGYSLALSTTNIPDSAGSDLSSARTISAGTSSSPTNVVEFVGIGDEKDLYKVTIGAPGSPSATVTASLTGVGGNVLGGSVSVRLRDGLGNVLETAFPGSGGGTLFTETLAQGTYYIEVDQSIGNSDYSLNIAADLIPDQVGNSLLAARSISPTGTFTDFVGAGDSDDYYVVNLSAPRTLGVTVTGEGGNLLTDNIRVQLLDNLGSVERTAFGSNSSAAVLSPQSLAAGTYYVRVQDSFAGNDGTKYRLVFT